MKWLPVQLLLLLHILLIVVWLGFDLVVFSLSVSLLKRDISPARRLERAHVAEVLDRWVLIVFLLTLPVGFWLAYLKGWSVFETPWLMLKLIVMGVIILLAFVLLTGSAGTTAILKKLEDGDGNADELEADLRKRVIGLAPSALLIHLSIVAMIFIALNPNRW